MFSVIIPSYNQQEFLPDAIESALNQTYFPLEVIVVDDGSTDNSLAIARNYGVRVVSQVNKGLSSARNTGIMNAEGEYLVFLDADDILLENYLQKIKKVIDETKADIVAPSFKEFGVSHRDVILMENPTITDFMTANRIGYCTAIKREALLQCGGYSPKMTWGAEDYHLWFDLLSRGKKLVTIQDILWLYRVKSNSMWTETAKHQEEYMNQIKKDFNEVWNG